MREALGFFLALVICLGMIKLANHTLNAYNNYMAYSQIVTEVNTIDSITKTKLKQVNGDVLVFEDGILNIKTNQYSVKGNPMIGFKRLKVTVNKVDSVKFDYSVYKSQDFYAGNLYAIVYEYKVQNDLNRRVVMVSKHGQS